MRVASSLRSLKSRFKGLKVVRRGKRRIVVIPKALRGSIPGRAKACQGK